MIANNSFASLNSRIMDIDQFKHNIKLELKKRSMTMQRLSKKMGVNRSYVSHLTNPTFDVIVNIANAIGCKTSDLLQD